jgi:hypothetical protein
MAWTYGGDLENSDRDMVRFLLGDTGGETRFSPADTEVDYWISVNIRPDTGKPDRHKAASEIATAMGNRFSLLYTTDLQMGRMKLTYDYPAMAQRYYELAKKLLMGRTAVAVGGPVFDTSISPTFSLGMMDHP